MRAALGPVLKGAHRGVGRVWGPVLGGIEARTRGAAGAAFAIEHQFSVQKVAAAIDHFLFAHEPA